MLTVAGEGPPVLLLHGYADSADTWRAILSRFAAAGRAATALDLRGFATAEPLHPSRPLLPQWDEMVEAAVEFAKAGTDPAPEDALKYVYA